MSNIISRGFGALQRVITRGFSSAAPPSPDCFLGFNGKVTGSQGFEGLIDDSATALMGLINDDPVAVIGTVYPQIAFSGIITDREGFNGPVTDKEGFQGEICDC